MPHSSTTEPGQLEARRPAAESATATLASDSSPAHAFYPWRRYFARTLDLGIYGLLWQLILVFGLRSNIASKNLFESLFDSFVTIAIMLALEPLWLWLLGTTPGKAIFGLQLTDLRGRRLSYGAGLRRTWGVVGAGMGYNLPIYSLVRLWKSYRRCSDNRALPWDEGLSYTVKDTRGFRWVLWVGAHVLLVAGLALAIAAQYIPPNRGDLTIAEFSENHAHYADLLSVGFGNEYLNRNGQWAQRPFDGTAYIQIGAAEMPVYQYTLTDGHLSEVSFEVALENRSDWLRSYDAHMILISLALAGAQDEMVLFSQGPKRIAETISANTFGDFYFVESGVALSASTRHSGYVDTSSRFLVPDDDASENSFHLRYSARRLD